ncbi:stimulated by retinoic acid gene 6 protein-like isoform X2 [Hydra vulgaris]|uniref:stimulated by retinoic acid gene 6 protein-like isoform X2 n=1 Tax=Hydra vulgaris TaxID=6087 RepID=UPI001F5E6F7B|nr:stimulated by retinoic acid gene 6 protein-like isoform X2 [Hydra vulgaris]
MVMNHKRISSIASSLINYGYLSKSNEPSQLLSYVNSININKVQNIANVTGIAREEVFNFFNTTHSCIINAATPLNNTATTFNNSFKSNETMKSIFSLCFYLDDQLNDEQSNDYQLNYHCDIIGWNHQVIVFICSLAYIFMIIMTFFTKRKFLASTLCWGRPGCLFPVNMLDSYENRFGYALSFGLTASSCYSVISSEYYDIVGMKMAQQFSLLPFYLSVFVTMMLAAIISVSGAPFLICQRLDNQLVGGLIGLCMSLGWFVYELSWKIPILSACSLGNFKLSGFIWMQTDKTKSGNEYIYKYVASLLNSKQKELRCDDNKLTKFKFKWVFDDNKSGFKFSLRIISSTFISCLAVYIAFIQIIRLYELLFVTIENSGDFKSYKTITDALLELLGKSSYIKQLVICIKVSIWIAALLSVSLFLYVMVNSLLWYRFHILSLRKGDWSFLPPSLKRHELISSIDIMVSSMNFAGYQVAYSLWGFSILFMALFVILMFISHQIILPIINKENSFLLRLIISYWPTILIGCVLIILQRLLARFILLIEKDVLAVDNRRIFHGTAFFLLYFNIFVGVFLSALRIIYSLTLGVLFYQRMQKSSLPRSFENWDNGYMSYIGYILLEHYHTNPVLQCFVRLLLENKERKFLTDDSDLYSSFYSLNEALPKMKNFKKTRALNRWHLYVLLLQNPSLQKFRSHRIVSKNDSTKEKKPHILFRTITNLCSGSKHVFNDSEYFGENNEYANSTLRKLSNWSTVPLDNSNANGQF